MKFGLPYWTHFPDMKGKLEPTKRYWFGKVAEGMCPPKGKVVRYSRNTRMYLVEVE